jgi:acyl carrier protein
MSPINTAIRTFISDTFFVDTFADDDSFMKTGVLDSTGMLELINFLEETWHFDMQDDELVPENLDSVNRATAFVEKKLQKSAA